MKILFVHQNFPGQFLHLAPALMARGHECLALTDGRNGRKSAVPTLRYRHETPAVDPAATRLGRSFTTATDRGLTVARAARQLRDTRGFIPDLIVAHPGWGETLFLKEVFPAARLLLYAEFYYRTEGQAVGFDPEFSPVTLESACSTVARTAAMNTAFAMADAAVAPTRWQAGTFPTHLRQMIEVIHDGVDCARLAPNPQAQVTLPGGQVLRAGDEVLTFVNRNLEPYRGYHSFMRALPAVLAARPAAQVVVVGGDGVAYGAAAPDGKSWKQVFLDEVAGRIDTARVHFTGRIPYPTFVSLMQVARVHAYLTYPFVLSWSMIEAMAAGLHVVASDTPPVTEVIRDGENGQLVDFFDIAGWSRALIAGLATPERFDLLRRNARKTALHTYDLSGQCLPRMIAFVERVGAQQP
jgi:glycosyltransferase involved in cell wall biosynthesis